MSVQDTFSHPWLTLPSLSDYNEDHNRNKFVTFSCYHVTVLVNVYCHGDGIFMRVLLSNKNTLYGQKYMDGCFFSLVGSLSVKASLNGTA